MTTAEGTVPVSQTRIGVVEPLRGIAALAVAWFHFTNGGNLDAPAWLKATGSAGWLGVEVFFVVSGFVIPLSMSRGGFSFPRHLPPFIAKRVLRLDPPYLLNILICVGLMYASAAVPGYAGAGPDFSVSQLALHLGYLNTVFERPWVNPVYWTLAIEFQFYLLVALVYPAIASRSGTVRRATLACLCIFPWLGFPERFVPHFLGLFVLGVVAFQIRERIVNAREGALVAALVAITNLGPLGPSVAIVGAATTACLLWSREVRLPALEWAGLVSYSLYLLHVPVGGRFVNLLARFATSPAEKLAVAVGAMGVSLVASAIVYRLVEAPSRRWSSAIRYAKKGSTSGRDEAGPGNTIDASLKVETGCCDTPGRTL